jgi:hypothetical protein
MVDKEQDSLAEKSSAVGFGVIGHVAWLESSNTPVVSMCEVGTICGTWNGVGGAVWSG